jgi:hypothetical protein
VNGGRSAHKGQTVRAWCRLSGGFLVKDGQSARRGQTVRVLCRLSSLADRAICHTCRVLHKCGRLFFLNGLRSPSPGSPLLLGAVISAFGIVSIPLGTIEAWSILDRLF